jgi:hypothetical protein
VDRPVGQWPREHHEQDPERQSHGAPAHPACLLHARASRRAGRDACLETC